MIFDQYSRYLACVSLLRHAGCNDNKVLDVGSGPECLLGSFMEESLVTYLDPLIGSGEKERQIAGDIFSPILDGHTYDFVTAVDVLEHVPPERRTLFLERVAKIARKGMVIGFPALETPEAGLTDDFVDAGYRVAFGTNYPWLVEHYENGLPSAQETCALLCRMGWHCQIVGHGHAPWLKELLSLVIRFWDFPELHDMVLRASAAFNRELASFDFMPPHYRTFVVASKAPLSAFILEPISREKAQELESTFAAIVEALREDYSVASLRILKAQQTGLLDANSKLRELSNWGKSASDDVVRRDDLIGQLSNRVTEMAAWGSKLSSDVAERDDRIVDLNRKLEEMSSWGGKLSADVTDRDSRIAELSRKLEDMSLWGGKLSSDVAERDDRIAELTRKVDEMSSWGSRLSLDVAERDARIAELHRKIEETSSWGNKSSSEVAQRDALIAELNRKVDEMSSWGSKASLDVGKRDARIGELNRKIEEMSSWGTKLSSTLAERDSLIAELSLKVGEVSSWGSRLSSALAEKDDLIAELRRKVEEASYGQSGIGSS